MSDLLNRIVTPLQSRKVRLAISAAIIAAIYGVIAVQAARTPTVSLAAAPSVNVFPIPGARFAAPQTQITFRGVPAGSIGAVTVTGSKSGAHSGKILADSDGDGGSFIPDHTFTRRRDGDRGHRSEHRRGAATARYSFQVANPTSPLPILHWPAGRAQPRRHPVLPLAQGPLARLGERHQARRHRATATSSSLLSGARSRMDR